MAFSGIPAAAFEFYAALSAENTREFWQEHKDDYVEHVKEPLLELGDELSEEFGEPKLFRPYRDIRFSRDKSPYKDHQGMFVDKAEGVGWYLQVSASGLMAAGGWYTSDPPQVRRFRQAVDCDESNSLAEIIAELRRKGFEISGEQLKTQPRGVSVDHPRVQLLRFTTLYGQRNWEPASWMQTRRLATVVRTSWRNLEPLLNWLAGALEPEQH